VANESFTPIVADELSTVTGGAGFWETYFPGFVPGAVHPREKDPVRMRKYQESQAALRDSLFRRRRSLPSE
jgi:hypothetical protein